MAVVVMFALALHAKDVEYPFRNLIEQGDYTMAWEKLQKQQAKSPKDYTVAFAFYRLYSARDNQDYDARKAYTQLCQSQDYLQACNAKEIERAEAAGYTAAMYDEEYAHIGLIALNETSRRKTIAAWNDWLQCYKRVPEQLIAEATEERDAIAYQKAQQAGTLSAYEEFVRDYPQAQQVPQAMAQIYELAYRKIAPRATEKQIKEYCRKYPGSPYAQRLNDLAAEMEIRRTIKPDDWRAQRQYLLTHKDANRWRDTVTAYFMQTISERHIYDAAKWGVKNLPHPQRDSCWMILRGISLEAQDLQPLVRFHTDYANYAIKDVQKKDLQMIADNERNKLGELRTDQLIDILAPYYPAYTKLQQLIADDVKNKRWNVALTKVQAHEKAFGADYRFVNLLRTLQEKDDPQSVATPVGPGVNTPTGNEYEPTVSADGKSMYFCATKREDNIGNEDIFLSKRTAGDWGKAVPLKDVNTADNNEAPMSLSTNGTMMLVFLNGKIAATYKTKRGWTALQPVPGKANSSDWQADAMITSDGKAMLYAALVKASNEQDISINIFVSLLQNDGSWGAPIDLGPTINTPMIDRSPFLHPDMRTLYFCSEGHGSLGGTDVFVSTRLNENSWTEWSTPVNMGKLINTTGNETWYKISTDGKLAYFSKRINNQNDIYQLNIPEHLRPQPVATISGKIVDSQGEPVVTSIRWEDLEAQQLVGLSTTDPTDGSFFIVLPEGKNYGYYVDDAKLFPISNNIDLRHTHQEIKVENNIEVVTIEEMIEKEIPVPINNIFFNTAEWDLLPPSIAELTRVAKIIRRQDLKVEISGHTDNVGDDESNLILSHNRANSVRDYLVSIGIDADLLTTKGYGESRPIATNKTPEGRQKNRRVELKFLKPDKPELEVEIQLDDNK